MFGLVLELVQRLSILTLHFSASLSAEVVLSSITQKEIRENLVEADWLRKQCWGYKEDSGFVYPVLYVESGEPSPGLCCSSGLDTPLGWAGSSNVSRQKPGAPLFLGRVRML